MQTKNNNNATILVFKYTTSKGRNTYGYNIVTLYANGKRVARTCGGGYDMRGTSLGQYLSETYREKLKSLTANYGSMDNDKGFYGLVHIDEMTGSHIKEITQAIDTEKCHTYIDGGCGENAVRSISEAIGLHLESIEILPNEWGYILTDTQNG